MSSIQPGVYVCAHVLQELLPADASNCETVFQGPPTPHTNCLCPIAGGIHTVHTIHCTHIPTSRTPPCSARKWSRMGPLVLFCVLNVLCVCTIYTEAQACACTYWEHRHSLATYQTWVMKLQQPSLSRATEPSPIPLPKSTKSKLFT